MSQTTKQLDNMNTMLRKSIDAGGGFWIGFNGRPQLRILSSEPFAYEKYGMFRNRGPQLVGRFAVTGLLYAQSIDDVEHVNTYIAFTAEENMYGKAVGAQQVNKLAELITGQAGDYFTPVFLPGDTK
jgi:hypothetical protein